MKWLETKIKFDGRSNPIAAEIISDVLYNEGVKGLVIGDPDNALAEDFIATNGKLPDENCITAYFPHDHKIYQSPRILENTLLKVSKEAGIEFNILYHLIEENSWADSWKTHFHTTRIGRRIVIRPVWENYHPEQNDVVIDIDPGMAFGTGNHPTTAMCIRLIEKYLVPGASFLDVGTGSGILTIVAAKLGAATIIGIDNDKIAVNIAEKNIKLNDINMKELRILSGNLTDAIEENFDLIAANILAETIILLIPHVKRNLKKNGQFICAGIIKDKMDYVLEKLRHEGFLIQEILSEDDWVSIISKPDDKVCL